MWRRLAIVLILMSLCACAPKVRLYGNGFLMPQESSSFAMNGNSGFRGTVEIARYYEESEESIYPEYLNFDQSVTLKADTINVSMNLWVWNPRAWKYRVVKTVDVDGVLSAREIYRGKKVDKRFQLQGPLEPGTKVKMRLYIYVGPRAKKPTFVLGDVVYSNRKGGDTVDSDSSN